MNFGITTEKATAMTPKITRITTAIIQAIEGESVKTLIKAPIPIIGAKQTIRKSIIVTFCTWVISFVVRVINEAVEK